MKIPKKFIVIGLIVLVAIVAGYLIYPKPSQKSLEFATVKRQDLKSTISASGVLTGKSALDLKFKSSGKMISLNVKSGDNVYRGQILASLDNRDQAIALQQAQNTLRDKQATVDKVLDDIHLFQYGNGGFANVGTANETMTQRQLRTTAEVGRDNAFDSIKNTQKTLEDTIIFAPVAGIITQANFVPGQIVGTSDSIVKMLDTSQIFFDADIDEADVSKISLNQPVEINLDAYPGKVFKGEVWEIQPFTKTTSSGVTVVTARISLVSEIRFINGLTGQAAIITSETTNSLTIPQEALREDNTVVIQTDQGLRPKKVVLGIKSDTDVEIKEGLNEGEKVVLNPPAKLR